MATRGLLVRLEAKPGMDEAVEEFLRSALPLVEQEPATTAWFAVRFGRSEYGIFDVFPDDAGRNAHLNGAIAKALMGKAEELFAKPPQIEKLNVLAEKLGTVEDVSRGLLLTFRAKEGHEADVERFLAEARTLVTDEPKTLAWFAIHLDSGDYGIFDVFPDNAGRFAHIVGHVPRELAKHALLLIGSMPDMEMLHVLASSAKEG